MVLTLLTSSWFYFQVDNLVKRCFCFFGIIPADLHFLVLSAAKGALETCGSYPSAPLLLALALAFLDYLGLSFIGPWFPGEIWGSCTGGILRFLSALKCDMVQFSQKQRVLPEYLRFVFVLVDWQVSNAFVHYLTYKGKNWVATKSGALFYVTSHSQGLPPLIVPTGMLLNHSATSHTTKGDFLEE